MPTTPRDPATPAWRQHLEEDMADAARELMGAGYTPSYYQQIAADFMPAAEGAVAEAVATFREALARGIEASGESGPPTMGDQFDDMQVRPWARFVRDFKMEG